MMYHSLRHLYLTGAKENEILYLAYIFKGGYLDFSHLTELKNIYITEICMKKQDKSSIIKNHKKKKKKKRLMFP